MSARVVKVRAQQYRGKSGFGIGDGQAQIWCRTKPCAEYIADMLRIAPSTDDECHRKIGRALQAESEPDTVYPPPGAGDVIGARS